MMAPVRDAEFLTPADIPDHNWTEVELVQFGEYLNGLPTWQPSQAPPFAIGQNDPLADQSPWRTYQECIWISDEDTNTKIMLLCISRFMDRNLRASSMSYLQVAVACSFSETTAKRSAKAARERWLRIEVGKGRYVPGKGSENLYHGIIPKKWLAELRRLKAKGQAVTVDEGVAEAADGIVAGISGVADRHPESSNGVSHRHPETDRGIPQTQPGYPTDLSLIHI